MRHFAAMALAMLLAHPACAQQEGLPADPRAAQSGRIEVRERQALAALTRNAATAQALGNLASKRIGGGRMGELSQSMAVTNGGLAEQLAQIAGPENMPLRERIDQNEVQRLQALPSADRDGLSRELLAWINQHYPDTIRNMEMLGQKDPRYAPLAEATLPQLRAQLAAAQDFAQAAMEGVPQQAEQQPGR